MKDLLTGLDIAETVQTELLARIEKAKAEWIEGARNDADFIKKLRSEEAGKFFKSQEKAYKRAFPDLKLEDIEGDGLKRMEAILTAGVKTLEAGKDATNQELQQKYLDLHADYEKYKEETVPEMLNQQKTKYQTGFIDDGIFKDAVDIDSTAAPEFRPAIVDAYLGKNGLKKVWDEDTNSYTFLTKDNLKPTKDDKPLSEKDIITAALEAAGTLTKSNGAPAGTTGKDGQPAKRPAGKLSENAQAMLDSFQNAG